MYIIKKYRKNIISFISLVIIAPVIKSLISNGNAYSTIIFIYKSCIPVLSYSLYIPVSVFAIIILMSLFLLGHLFVSNYVRYGDIVKLRHIKTNHNLHSHNHHYDHQYSSGQQQVTCFSGKDDNDFWIIKGPNSSKGYSFKKGKAVKHGDEIRLEHLATSKHLHSHLDFLSPSGKNQEVTCFKGGDDNDNWIIEIESILPKVFVRWKYCYSIKLKHSSTKKLLSSYGPSTIKSLKGQQEVSCLTESALNNYWKAIIQE